MKFDISFGRWLKQRRKALDLTQQDVADQVGCAVVTIRKMEADDYRPSKQIAERLADVMMIALDDRTTFVSFARRASESPADMYSAPLTNNLPQQITPFVGRRQELSDLAALLNDPNTRQITILAPGGMGKTRLAIETTRLQLGQYADGVIFVPLAPLSSPNDIVTTIADHIGFSFYGKNTPAQQLVDFLRDRSMLLVLDNFEHLLDGIALIAAIMHSAAGVQVLTTSRERLNLQGETVYTLRGMDFPTRETPADMLAYDVVKLFMQSAQRIRFDYELQAHDLDHLVRICRLTEGMPLGIELAAGWTDVLSLERIAVEIQKGIDILETEMRDVPERHRSLRATFEGTWERLTGEEQQVFMRLSVFRGSFTVYAAQMVAEADVRLLRKLTSKALIRVAQDDRHDIHELLRQFGGEKLRMSGEDATVQAAHAAFFADFMAERRQDIRTNRQLDALELIDPDFENVRSAWQFAVSQQQWDQLPKFLHSLWFYLDARTRAQEGIALLEFAVEALHDASNTFAEVMRGSILARLGWFYDDRGLAEIAKAACDEAMGILRQHDSPEDLIAVLYSLQHVAFGVQHLDIVVSASNEGLRLARAIGDNYWEGCFLVWAGWASIGNSKTVAALQFAEEARVVLRTLGDQWGLMMTYKLLGWINHKQRNDETAAYWTQQSLVCAEAFRHDFSLGFSNTLLGAIALNREDFAAAHLHLRKALQVYWSVYKNHMLPFPLVYIARMYAEQHDVDQAVEILAALQRHLTSYMETDVVARELRDQLELKLDPERFNAIWVRGRGRELGSIVGELLTEEWVSKNSQPSIEDSDP